MNFKHKKRYDKKKDLEKDLKAFRLPYKNYSNKGFNSKKFDNFLKDVFNKSYKFEVRQINLNSDTLIDGYHKQGSNKYFGNETYVKSIYQIRLIYDIVLDYYFYVDDYIESKDYSLTLKEAENLFGINTSEFVDFLKKRVKKSGVFVVLDEKASDVFNEYNKMSKKAKKYYEEENSKWRKYKLGK